MIIVMPGKAFHGGAGIFRAQSGKRGALRQLKLEYAVFKPQPEKPLVVVRFLVLLKRAKKRHELGVIIVLARRAENAVPIEVGVAVAVVCLKIRLKIIASRAVPYNV